MPKDATLSRAEYRALLWDVTKLVAQSKQRPADAKLDAYWQIGLRIREQKIASDSGYASAIIRDLAADLHVSRRALYDAVSFATEYDAPPDTDGISWTHYRVLLRLPAKKDRNFYIKVLKKERWSTRRLEAAIEAGLHFSGTPAISVLDRPSDPQYVYAAEVLQVVDGDTLDLSVDLGFGVFRKLRARLANVDAPELPDEKARAARNFLINHLTGARTVVVKTVLVDLYGRYVVHLFFSQRRVSLASCYQEGFYLNDLLLQAGHAAGV